MVSYITASLAGAKDHSLTDYMPRWGAPEAVAEQPVDDMVAALRRLASRAERKRD